MANNSFIDLAGSYLDAFNDLGYTTAFPATGPSGSLGASPEQSGFSFPEGVSPDKKADIMNQQWQIETVLGQINKGSSPEEMERKFQMLDRLQAKQADRMRKYGIESNIIAAALKQLPKAIAGPEWAKARYADLEAQGPLLAAQSIRPVFSNRDYINL